MIPEREKATACSTDCNMQNMPLPQVHRLFKKHASPGAVMRTNDVCDYIWDDDDVSVMFMDDNGRAYIAIGNVADLAHSNSEVDKNNLDDCAYLNRLEKANQSRVQVDDGDALFVLLWYDEVGRNGGIVGVPKLWSSAVLFAIGN